MGAWGDESCSNDSCWDWLGSGGVEDIHEMKQEEVEPCLEHVFSVIGDDIATDCDKLGCVIWFLRHGLMVPKKFLHLALPITNKLLENVEESGYNPECRRRQLSQEHEDVLEALAGNGTIEPKHIPGLLEKICGVTDVSEEGADGEENEENDG
jgi:hypothetical protein